MLTFLFTMFILKRVLRINPADYKYLYFLATIETTMLAKLERVTGGLVAIKRF